MKNNIKKGIVFLAVYLLVLVFNLFVFTFGLSTLNITPPSNIILAYIFLFWLIIGFPLLISIFILKKYLTQVTPLALYSSVGVLTLLSFFSAIIIFQPHTPSLSFTSIDSIEKNTLNLSSSTQSFILPDPTPTTVFHTIDKLALGEPEWLKFPKLVSSLDILESSQVSECIKNSSFQHVATFSNGFKLINYIFRDECGMGASMDLIRLIQTTTNKVYVVLKNQESVSRYDYYSLKPSVDFADIVISGIYSPENLNTKYGQFQSTNFFFDDTISFTQLKDANLLDTTAYGNLYSVYNDSKNDYGLLSRYFYLRHKDDTVDSYDLHQDIFTDDRVAKITWNDGSINKDQFDIALRTGCGGNYQAVFNSSSPHLKDLTPKGKLSDGTTVYGFANKNNFILQQIFKDRPYADEDQLTLDQFISSNSHFLYQDSLKDWRLYVNQKYVVAAECGKPVIYLYPPQDTQVNVRVGAQITKSEPTYPENGWTVLAHPDGQLDYQGQSYPSLFWEGLGYGEYPNITSQGVVVTQSELIPALRTHLSQLGLNDQESTDFLEFWQPRLPSNPYVRLSWILTQDMDKLAPLSVRPAPDTHIRVFLDFEGLDQPIKLTPQRLSAPPRQGFTLIEWGGLLVK
jgi:hypothetical protein